MGCSKSLPEDVYAPNGRVVGFYSSGFDDDDSELRTTPTTNNSTTSFESGDQFGVLGYQLHEGTSDITGLTPSFMYNQWVTNTDGTNWRYDPKAYWPTNVNDKLQFFAYFPYNGKGVKLSQANITGYPILEYIPSDEARSQYDLMTAMSSPLGKDDHSGEVPLSFKHELSQVMISIQHNGSGSEQIKIKEVALQGVRAFKGKYSNGGFDWTEMLHSTEANKVYEMKQSRSEIIPDGDQSIDNTSYKPIYTGDGVFLLPPQVIADHALTIKIKYTIVEEGVTTAKEFSITSTEAITFTKNKAANLQILLDIGGIEEPYIKLEVMPWQTVENNINMNSYPAGNFKKHGWTIDEDNDLTNPGSPSLDVGDWVENPQIEQVI